MLIKRALYTRYTDKYQVNEHQLQPKIENKIDIIFNIRIILINFFYYNKNIEWNLKFIIKLNKLHDIKNIIFILQFILQNMVSNDIIKYNKRNCTWIKSSFN